MTRVVPDVEGCCRTSETADSRQTRLVKGSDGLHEEDKERNPTSRRIETDMT